MEAHRHDHQCAIHVLRSLGHIQGLNIDVHLFVHQNAGVVAGNGALGSVYVLPLKWKEGGRRNRRERGTCGMMIHFVLLASGTTCDKGIDKRGEAQHQKSCLTMALVWKRPACPVVGDPWREENKREAC